MGAESIMNTFMKAYFALCVHVWAYIYLYIPIGDFYIFLCQFRSQAVGKENSIECISLAILFQSL